MKTYIVIDTLSIVNIVKANNRQSVLAYCRDNDIQPVYIREQLKF